MKKDKPKVFVDLITDSSITNDAWSDVFVLVGCEKMSRIVEECNKETIRKAYLGLKNAESRFKFMQVWSQFEDFKSFSFFVDQISKDDIETSEIIFDNLRNWDSDNKSKLELLEAIKKVDQKSKLLEITIAKLNS